MVKLNVLPAVGHPDEVQETHAGMAYFANTGPLGLTCGKCGFYTRGRCGKFRELTKQGGGVVPKQTPSCKYFASDEVKLYKPIAPVNAPLFENLPTQFRPNK